MYVESHHTLQCSWGLCRADQDLPPRFSLPVGIPRSTLAAVVVVVAVAAAKHVGGLTRPSGRS